MTRGRLFLFNLLLAIVILTVPVCMAQSIAGGYNHSIYLTSLGAVYAWGQNNYGQLGNGNTGTNSNVPVAVDMTGVLSGKTITMVAGGTAHTVALASDGTVYAWGQNNYGQLGNGNTGTNSNVPVAVDMSGVLSGKTITAVACGYYHVVALASDGTVYVWGYNYHGQLGNGNYTDSNIPVAVNMSGVLSGKTITAVACGAYHTLVLASDGTVYAWGYNSDGQLGNGNTSVPSNVPVAVYMAGTLLGKTITSVFSLGHCAAVLASDGTVYTWGNNYYGQLGNGNNTSSNVPVAVDMAGALSGKTVTTVAGGPDHMVTVASDGAAYTWGNNYYGHLGSGTNSDSNVPVAVDMAGVLSGKIVTTVAGGRVHTLALASDGTVYAWGGNGEGQLGNGTNTDSNVPVAVENGGTTPIENNLPVKPTTYYLTQNYPNPFNPGTEISYSIPKEVYVTLTVYNVLGQKVFVVQKGKQSAGQYLINIDGSKLSSGIYLYRLVAGNYVQTKKMILMK